MFVTNLTFFYVGSIDEESTEDIEREKKLTSEDEDFFYIFLPTVKYEHHQTYLHDKMAFFPSYEVFNRPSVAGAVQ